MKGVVERHGIDRGIDGGAGKQETDAGVEEVHDAPDVCARLALVVGVSKCRRSRKGDCFAHKSAVLIQRVKGVRNDMRNLGHAGLLVVELPTVSRNALVPLVLRGVVEVFQDHTPVAIASQTQFAEVRETGVCSVVWFYLCARVGRDEGGDGWGSAAGGFQGGEEPLDEVVGEDLETGVYVVAVGGGEGWV